MGGKKRRPVASDKVTMEMERREEKRARTKARGSPDEKPRKGERKRNKERERERESPDEKTRKSKRTRNEDRESASMRSDSEEAGIN